MHHFKMAWTAAVLVCLAVAGLGVAANVDWVGPLGGDWNVGSNWSPVPVPGPGPGTGDNVFVLAYGGAVKTISLASGPTPAAINELVLAREGNGVVTVNQTGGDLTVNSWLNLGQGFGAAPATGTGIYNLSGNAILRSTHSAGGATVIGVGFVAGTYGEMNLSGSAQFIQTAGDFRLVGETAALTSSGKVTVADSALLDYTGGNFVVGNGIGTASLVQTGGTVNIKGSHLWLGRNVGSVGNYTLQGGLLNEQYDIRNDAGTAVFNQSGSSAVTAAYLRMGLGAGSNGTYNLSGGTLTVSTEVDFGAMGVGAFTLSGAASANLGSLFIGRSQWNETGGRADVVVKDSALLTSAGDINLSGTGGLPSTMTVQDSAQVTANVLRVGNFGQATMTQTSGTVNSRSWVVISQQAGAVGTYTLSGGTLNVNTVGGGDFQVGVQDGGTGTLNLSNNAAVNILNARDLRIGSDHANSRGYVTQGNTSTMSGNILQVGQTGLGSYLLKDSAVATFAGNTFIGNAASAVGTLEVRDAAQLTTSGNDFRVGNDGKGTLIQSGGAISTGRWFQVGQQGNAVGTFTMSGGTLEVNRLGGGNMQVGTAGTATGTVTLSNNAALTIQGGGGMWLGSDSATARGFVTQSGASTVLMTGDLILGRTGLGVYTFNGASITAGRVRLGTGGSAVGAFYHDGGTLTTTGAASVDHFAIGNTAGSYGYYALANGSVTTIEANPGVYGTGVLNVSGGTFASTNWLNIGRAAGQGLLNLTGGVLNMSGSTNEDGFNVGWDSLGVLNVGGSGILRMGNRNLNITRAGGAGIVNLLGGGTIETDQVRKLGTGRAQVNFHGGTLLATADTGNLVGGLNEAFVWSEGARIDTNGFAATLPQALLAPTGQGVTAIALGSAGSGYVGEPIVQIAGDGVGATARAIFDRATGTITSIVITNPGTGYTTATASLIGGGTAAPATLGTVSLAANASGGLAKLGNGTLTLTGANTFTGDTRSQAGTLAVNNALALQFSTLDMNGADSGAVTFAQASTIGGLKGSRPLNYAGNALTLGNNNTDQTYSGSLSGTSALSKIGTGTQTLTGTSTVSSDLNARFGTLEIAGGTLTVTGTAFVAPQAGDTGRLLISGTGWMQAAALNMGNAAGAVATIDQTGGTFRTTNTGDVNLIGVNATGKGVYNISGGLLEVAGNWQTGYNGTGELLASGSGTVNVAGWFIAGRQLTGVGTISAAGNAAVNANGSGMIIGELGKGTLKVADSAQVRANHLRVGYTNTATGTAEQTGGTVTVNGDILIAEQAGAIGTYTLSNGVLNANGGVLRVGDFGTGTLNQTGGTINAANWFVVGERGNKTSTFNMSGGVLNVNTNGGAERLQLSASESATGIMNLSGNARVTVFGTGGTQIGGTAAANVGLMTVADTARMDTPFLSIGPISAGTMTMTGGLVKTPNAVLALNAGSTGTVNLNGGTFEPANLYRGAGTAALNLAGGTLTPGTVRFNTVNAAGTLEVSQQGWTAAWYDGNAMTDAPDAWNPYTLPLYVETVDAVNWGGGYPAVFGGDQDYNGAVFSARLYVPQAGNYSFREQVDDSTCLYVDGNKILWDYTNGSDLGEAAGDPWTVHATRTIPLSQGWHLLDLRYSDHWGGQSALLQWDPAGGSNWQTLNLAGLGTDIGMSVIAGDYTQGAAGTLALDVMGLPFGFDQLLVAGTARLDGILDATAGPGVKLGDRYVVLNATTLIGMFDAATGDGFSFADGYWRVSYDYQAGTVTLEAAAPEPLTLGLLALGAGSLGGYIRRRRTLR